jgi:hypothetical protein
MSSGWVGEGRIQLANARRTQITCLRGSGLEVDGCVGGGQIARKKNKAVGAV